MSSPIRPSVPPALPVRPQAPNDVARAAQRAFFSQALGQVQGAAAAAAAPALAPAPLARTPAAASTPAMDPASPPERALRPGSLVDIKV